ncbi:uncharacterized protein KIAA0930 homolog isoform X2 [Anneissia japonica]|uniref:uncharacterized protein KIAA0930 homolog isoform X2 n=1 Tax=Anneissia japonica TaxID=1529436 RepID=UPI0014257987|nr:uncharacterized protein KIAA0930 homolog isoform X2 [Anneissia japonica]
MRKMATPGRKPRRQSSFHRMISDIISERKKDKKGGATCEELGGYILMDVNCFWTKIFAEHFLEKADDQGDDMLFFVRRKEFKTRNEAQASIEVFRKHDSKNLPSLGDPSVDWEETVYLNLILHQFDYILTCAVCTKSDGKLQIFHSSNKQVFASPSKRRMDRKGVEPQVAYPNIFFLIDNFDEVFSGMKVQASQMVCVELVANERQGSFRSVVFLGCVRYEALKRVYDNRATMTSKMAEKVPMRFFQGAHGRIEFIRMKGPEGKGHAEMAVSRFRRLSKDGSYDDHSISSDGSGSNSVTSSPERTRYSSSCTSSPVPQPKNGMKKSSSDSGMLFQLTRESDDLPDNQNNSNFPVKLTRQGSDALQWLKRRTHKEPILNAHLTYVTLPWHRIIADVLEVRLEPVLS